MLIGFSPDGRRLATGPRVLHYSTLDVVKDALSPPDAFQVWNVAENRPPERMQLPRVIENNVLQACSVIPSSRQFFWRYLDYAERQSSAMSPNPFGVDVRDPEWRDHFILLNTAAFQFSQDRRLALRCNDDLTSNVVEWETGRVLLHVPATTVSFDFLPDGLTALSAQLSFIGDDEHAHYGVRRWNLKDGSATTLSEWDETSAKRNGGVSSGLLQLTPDGRWLVDLWAPPASSGPANGLIVWDTVKGQKHFAVPAARWFWLARNSHTLVTVHEAIDPSTPRLRLFDLETGAARDLFSNSPSTDVENVPVVVSSPNGKLLAIGVPDPHPHPLANWPRLNDWLEQVGIGLQADQSFVALIDATDGSERNRLPFGPAAWFEAPELSDDEPTMAFSDDGRRLAVLGEDAIRVWDLPIRRPWLQILSLAAIPPAALGLLLLAIRLRRRSRAPALAH
jgi:hypothetical protein